MTYLSFFRNSIAYFFIPLILSVFLTGCEFLERKVEVYQPGKSGESPALIIDPEFAIRLLALPSSTLSKDKNGDSVILINLGDLNGDGVDDFAMITPSRIQSERTDFQRVTAFSGSSADQLWQFDGESNSQFRIRSVYAVGDHNGDGFQDLILPDDGLSGRVKLLSGKTGSLIRSATLPPPGLRSISRIEDFTGDGRPELIELQSRGPSREAKPQLAAYESIDFSMVGISEPLALGQQAGDEVFLVAGRIPDQNTDGRDEMLFYFRSDQNAHFVIVCGETIEPLHTIQVDGGLVSPSFTARFLASSRNPGSSRLYIASETGGGAESNQSHLIAVSADSGEMLWQFDHRKVANLNQDHDIEIAGPFLLIPDMNNDGFSEIFSIITRVENDSIKRAAVIISGADGNLIRKIQPENVTFLPSDQQQNMLMLNATDTPRFAILAKNSEGDPILFVRPILRE